MYPHVRVLRTESYCTVGGNKYLTPTAYTISAHRPDLPNSEVTLLAAFSLTRVRVIPSPLKAPVDPLKGFLGLGLWASKAKAASDQYPTRGAS